MVPPAIGVAMRLLRIEGTVLESAASADCPAWSEVLRPGTISVAKPRKRLGIEVVGSLDPSELTVTFDDGLFVQVVICWFAELPELPANRPVLVVAVRWFTITGPAMDLPLRVLGGRVLGAGESPPADGGLPTSRRYPVIGRLLDMSEEEV
jgi:hypothetical protein